MMDEENTNSVSSSVEESSEVQTNSEKLFRSLLTHRENDDSKKVKKKGIIYLSTIPKFMTVLKIREIFSAYGPVGRVYLQLAPKDFKKKKEVKKQKRKGTKDFTEGWVEFESKKVAKMVALRLNNNQISTKKRSKFFDMIWNIKYLPRFKWVHLSERLAYERAVHKQRLRTEISQAKREANFFSYNVDRSNKLKKRSKDNETGNKFIAPEIKQRDTDMEIRQKKNQPENDRTEFIASLFG